jgi:hypothetical protein
MFYTVERLLLCTVVYDEKKKNRLLCMCAFYQNEWSTIYWLRAVRQWTERTKKQTASAVWSRFCPALGQTGQNSSLSGGRENRPPPEREEKKSMYSSDPNDTVQYKARRDEIFVYPTVSTERIPRKVF